MEKNKHTKITFLSHASIYIEGREASLLVDPWLIGSCYWRSWWNYPPVKKGILKKIKPDAVYITHVHWDHWHGVTLKKLIDKDTLIITHEEPNKRSVNDLKKIGFKNIKLLKHGQSTNVGDLKLSIYQFGLFLNDSALVVKNKDVNLLDANDCKIAGAALSPIIKKHGKFDFALRSHSSANDRILYKIKNNPNFINDDPEHYSRSFKYFMDAVKPNYAVPFASNHCYLHKDVFDLNEFITDPYILKKQLDEMGGLENSELKILVSGDSWSSDTGFEVASSSHYFLEKSFHIKEYLKEKAPLLEKFYTLESRLKINKKIISKFQNQIKAIPKLIRKKFKGWKFQLTLSSDKYSYNFIVDPFEAKLTEFDDSLKKDLPTHIHIPIKIFIDAVALNMFHHSSISKRNQYLFENENELKKYSDFLNLLEKVELEVYPLKVSYLKNLFFSYCRRWREILVYFKAFILLKKGLPIYDVEEEILKHTK